jgi:lipopolysaccharide export system protein LptA
MNALWLALAAAGVAAKPSERSAPAKVHVDAEEVQYQYKDRRAVFLGKPLVRLTREDAVLTCRRLDTENDEEGGIRRAVCTGDVKLVRGPKTATCERATFDNLAGRVVCTGNPVLREGESVMRGHLLTYDLDADRVTMSQARGTMVPTPEQERRTAKKKEEAR